MEMGDSKFKCKKLRTPLAVALLAFLPLVVSGRPLTPERFVVDQGSYRYWIFEVGRSARIFGQFRAEGSGANEIRVYLMDEGEFENFRNGKTFRSYYSSDRVSRGEINLRFYSGRYVVVFDNTFSASNKTVTSNLRIEED